MPDEGQPTLSGQDWYREYLSSPHWLKLRNAKIAAVGEQCERCSVYGKRGPGGRVLGLDVHHRNYARCPGRELLDDLEVLCIVCHEAEHGHAEDTEEYRERVALEVARRAAGMSLTPVMMAATDEDCS